MFLTIRGSWGNAKTFGFGRVKDGQRVPFEVCWWFMGSSSIDFQTCKTFLANLLFAEFTSLKYKNGDFTALPQHCRESRKLWKLFLGRAENYFIINYLRILYLFLLAVIGAPSFACRLIFSGICARAQVDKWMDIIFFFIGTTAQARCW